jgi:hypothetical protein
MARRLIDAEGIKLDSIARFKKQKTMFKVKQFLGLASYFRDHVPNFSVLEILLQKFVVGYTKSMRNRKVKLEGSALATFIYLKDLIDRAQKLFYFDIEEGEYGISAYLYILRKEVEIPIRLLKHT